MVTSKERVLNVFNHSMPDRVPLWYGADPLLTAALIRHCKVQDEEALLDYLYIDFRRVQAEYVGPPLRQFSDGTRENFWGVLRGGDYYGQPLTHPLAGVETMQGLKKYNWPAADWFAVTDVARICRQWPEKAIIGGPWAVVFTDAVELIGMEEFFIKMHTHPDIIRAVINRACDFYYEVAKRFFENSGGLIDIFFFGDDFGSQQALLINPKMWRRFCRSYIQRLNRLAKDFGLKTMFHSCGAIREIIPDLIEIGIDALNPVQPRANGMDLNNLKKDFGKKIVFHGAVDHQYVLLSGTAEEVQAEVRRVIDIMAPGGGFCLAPSHDYLLAEYPCENVVMMYNEAYRYGKYL